MSAPPQAEAVLTSYAKALKLEPDSRQWHMLFDLAAAETGRIPPQMAGRRTALEDLPGAFRAWRHQRTRSGPWTRATDLELWAHYRDAQDRLPQVVRRLIHATVEAMQFVEFPAGEQVQRLGWDGIIETPSGNAFVPAGLSLWEMGVDRDPAGKAEREFRKRTRNSPGGLDTSRATFVFVTPRRWATKSEWRDKKQQLGKWGDVRVYDSTNLEEWLETAPAVDAWLARLLGRRPDGVRDVDEYWENLYAATEPSLSPDVFLTARDDAIKTLGVWLAGSPSSIAFEAPSPGEVVDFLAAYAVSRHGSERERIPARMLIVEQNETWRILANSRHRLLLVPQPSLSVDAEMVAEAVRQGHHVFLCSHRFATDRTSKHTLSRLGRYVLEKALTSTGIGDEEASRLAREAGGSLTVLKRRLARFPSTRQPAWSEPPHAHDLLPLLLAGGWDDDSAADREILEQLAGRPYDEILAVATRWAASEDPPLIRLLSHWSLVSREDSWFLLAPHVTRTQLDRCENVAVEVLREENPRFDLAADDRWTAGWRGKAPKYSGQLRTGLAETLASLGAKSEVISIQDSTSPAQRAARVVRKVLAEGSNWKRWASLGRLLPTLAEASPDAFLEAVESDLRRNPPALLGLFADEGGPLLSSCNHAGLLWALETLAWEPALLSRASLALGRLAERALETQWSNRPINSLYEIFLPWNPQTSAPVGHRIEVLVTLTRRTPGVAWQLLLALLPAPLGSSGLTHRPHWRDWALNWSRGASGAEYWPQIEACADRLCELVGFDVDRWAQLIEKLERFPAPARERLVARLKTVDLQPFGSDARRLLTDAIREVIRVHRDHPYTNWTLPADTIAELEIVRQRLEPQDLIAKHLWLFVPYPRLPNETRENSWRDRDDKVFALRRDALNVILAESRLGGALELAKAAESSASVGFVVGKSRLLDDEGRVIPILLDSEDAKLSDFAIGFSRGCFQDAGWPWLDGLPLDRWSAKQAGILLAKVPDFARRTWETVCRLGSDVSQDYWSRADGFCRDGKKADVEYAVSMLLKHGRPAAALDVLGMAFHQRCEVDPSLLMETLEVGLRRDAVGPPGEPIRAHEIQEVFEHLQSVPAMDLPRLANLEWAYLRILDGHGAAPRTLHRLLQTDPKFFADVLALIFRSDKEPEGSRQAPSGEEAARAENAYRLLVEWKTVPGSHEDGAVGEQELLDWVSEARRLCQESGHLGVCDLRIGEVLAHAPAEQDGTWPCFPVRDVIDEIGSDELLRGFQIGIFNKRGVYGKSPTVGGNQERELSERYRSYAEACDTEWPTTATALRRVARRYEEDARREDERALERSLR